MIEIIEGNIFKSNADVIVHQTNTKGVMGSGIAKQVKQLYPSVFSEYKKKCDDAKLMRYEILGDFQLCNIGNNKYICNIFGQKNFGYDGKCYSNYEALRTAFVGLNEFCSGKSMSVAIPYLMSCHRGGGDWNIVSEIIEQELVNCRVVFYKYTEGVN